MAVEVVCPKLGNEIEACVIVAWRKHEGDRVAKGEAVCEIETDKATFEIESPASGVLLKAFYREGDEVPVLTVIAVVGQPGETVLPPLPPVSFGVPGAQVVPASSGPTGQPPAGPAPAHADAGVSPRARRIAEEAGLDVAGVPGTGPGGRLTEADVNAALAARGPVTAAAKAALSARPSAPDYSALGPVREIPVKGMRKAIAERMLRSTATTAQVTLHAAADATALRAARGLLKGDATTYGITINDLVLRAVARVLPAFPALNAWWLGDRIVEFGQVHLGIAVQTPRGLMAAVIRRASELSLVEISAEAKRLRQACLDGNAKPNELSGGTFTVTNLGPEGVEFFNPLLDPPQVAILGVGCIVVRPVEGRGGMRMVPHIGLSLTFDHQALDGHGAAAFLAALGETVARVSAEDPGA